MLNGYYQVETVSGLMLKSTYDGRFLPNAEFIAIMLAKPVIS
jgi:hypothetical protein